MKRAVWLWAALGMLLLLSGCSPEPAPSPDPIPTPEPAQVDDARLERGVVSVRYTAGTSDRVKVQIVKAGGEPYNYDLDRAGAWEDFPLTQGEGSYTLTVLEHLEENRYRPVYARELDLTLEDPLAPFLEPNQFVNYTADSAAARLAGELTAGLAGDTERAAALLTYVAEALEYDGDKAGTVEPGYLPDLEAVLDEGKGICLDYAALLTAMLRSQGIPARLVVGDSGAVYHAWVEVWCRDEGEVWAGIPAIPGDWTLLDPTFLSNGGEDPKVLAYVTDRENYTPRYVY